MAFFPPQRMIGKGFDFLGLSVQSRMLVTALPLLVVPQVEHRSRRATFHE